MEQYMVFTPGSSTPPRGPVSRVALAAEHRAGTLPTGARACPVGGGQWVPVAEVLGVTSTSPVVAADASATSPVPSTFEVTANDGETIIGPVTLEQLRRGVEAGKVPTDAKARLVGSVTWKPVTEVLRPTRTAPVAPAPPSPPRPPSATSGPASSSMVGPLGAVVVLVGAVGGLIWAFQPDLAAPGYQRCQDRETAGDIVQAAQACEEAMRADPTSTAGKAAKSRLAALAPKVAAEKKERARKKAADETASRQQQQAAQAEELAQAKRVVSRSAGYRDVECLGLSLPPYRVDYGGGTYAQNDLVARSENCRPLYPSSTMVGIGPYCCPR